MISLWEKTLYKGNQDLQWVDSIQQENFITQHSEGLFDFNVFKENGICKDDSGLNRTSGNLSCMWGLPKAWVWYQEWRLTLAQKKLEQFMERVEEQTQLHVNV